jgi:hypothetical protein
LRIVASIDTVPPPEQLSEIVTPVSSCGEAWACLTSLSTGDTVLMLAPPMLTPVTTLVSEDDESLMTLLATYALLATLLALPAVMADSVDVGPGTDPVAPEPPPPPQADRIRTEPMVRKKVRFFIGFLSRSGLLYVLKIHTESMNTPAHGKGPDAYEFQWIIDEKIGFGSHPADHLRCYRDGRLTALTVK